jgi:multidrug transporter EmrE-like cation transporter
MNAKTMVWLSVVLSAVAQVSLKHGLNHIKLRMESRGASALSLVSALALEIWVWLWAACFIVATCLWLLGVQRLDLSFAFPLLSVGYILVNLFSMLLFREHVDGMRWLAVMIICVGVIFIARS